MDGSEAAALAVDRGPAIASFVGYLALIVAIGVWAARFSSAGVAEFFVGGRRMHRFVVALSAVVSGRSAWLILGVVGLTYQRGASAVWAVVGYIVVELFLFLYFARRLRRFAEVHDCVTVPDVFAARFGDRSGALRLTLAAVFLLFIVGYVAGQFVAGGKAFATGFGLDPTAGILLTAGIVLAYTVLGGFLAVSVTDVVQALFMIVALVVVPAVAISLEGGLGVLAAGLAALDPALVDPTALGFGALLGFLGIGLGSPGNPHILARYLSIRNAEELRTAAVVGTLWNVVMAWGALFAGLAGRLWVPDPAALPAGDVENLYPFLASQVLPSWLFGLVIAAIFAAIMSTTDSQLLVAASAVVRDVYEKVLHRSEEVPQRRLVLLSRAVVLALVVLSVLMGFYAEQVVFWLVLFSWAGLGASLGPTSILALYWRGTTRAGVLAGLVAGAATVVVWKLTPALSGRLYELVPGFLAG
ncbi:MAG TPA: sodium/proline symporter, partial [Thermoanaerobaculia bacterium]|nr:sodium/proline symporter [Thermoanaerobaculia bacterium]